MTSLFQIKAVGHLCDELVPPMRGGGGGGREGKKKENKHVLVASEYSCMGYSMGKHRHWVMPLCPHNSPPYK